MTPAADDPRLLGWDAGDVLPAQYLASVTGLMHRELVDAHSDGATEAHLVLAELARVSVTVLEAATGDAVARARLDWADGDLEGVNSNQWAKVLRDRASGAFAFQAPRGTVQFRVEAAGYVSVSREIALTGDEELVVRLERASGVTLSFYDDGTRLPSAMEVQGLMILDPDTGESLHEDLLDMRADSRELQLILRPGRYELRFMHWPSGWKAREPIVVEVLPDRIDELRVQLERE